MFGAHFSPPLGGKPGPPKEDWEIARDCLYNSHTKKLQGLRIEPSAVVGSARKWFISSVVRWQFYDEVGVRTASHFDSEEFVRINAVQANYASFIDYLDSLREE